MHWKVKAGIQNAIAALPQPVSYALYYQLQRRFGRLHTVDPRLHVENAIGIWDRLLAHGVDPVGKTFCEIGTGHSVTVPTLFWLMGAARTITIDLHAYLKAALVRQTTNALCQRPDLVSRIGRRLRHDRWKVICEWNDSDAPTLTGFLDRCNITYVAPVDGAHTGLESGSVDVHTSVTVLEHIPPDTLRQVLVEAGRVLRPDGLSVHLIDYGDHFSHTSSKIPIINFLQYSAAQWAQYANNPYMYMNRLRHDDMEAIFHSAGHQILSDGPVVDSEALKLLQCGFPLSSEFQHKPLEILATTHAWIVSRNTVG
jgi:hypothetical protein